MMEAINGEQATFRRMDEILESVTHALELPLLQAERVVAEACRQWSELEMLVTQKLRILNNVRKMCVRMDKGRLPIVLKALEAIEDAEPEVATTLSGQTDNFASSLYGEFKRDDQAGQRTFSTNTWRCTSSEYSFERSR